MMSRNSTNAGQHDCALAASKPPLRPDCNLFGYGTFNPLGARDLLSYCLRPILRGYGDERRLMFFCNVHPP